jgi:hypothetical protein
MCGCRCVSLKVGVLVEVFRMLFRTRIIHISLALKTVQLACVVLVPG